MKMLPGKALNCSLGVYFLYTAKLANSGNDSSSNIKEVIRTGFFIFLRKGLARTKSTKRL